MDKIYTASKIWHNKVWRSLNVSSQYQIISNWINFDCGTKEKPGGARNLSTVEKINLWRKCIEDVQRCDLLIAYAEKGETHRGALVEIGAALSMGKPVYLIGNCKSFKENDNTSAIFTYHPLFNFVEHMVNGFNITGYKKEFKGFTVTEDKRLLDEYTYIPTASNSDPVTFEDLFLYCIKDSKSKYFKSS